MNEAKLIAEYTLEEIEAFGTLSPEDPVDFSYPDGFFKVANSLDCLPDSQTRVQMLNALTAFMLSF